MSKSLMIVEEDHPAPKKKRETISLIETQPEPDWFVPAKTKRGRTVWYLRFQMTGWNPRLYGPFKSKHQCLLFLDQAINEFQEMEPEVTTKAGERMVKEPCANTWLPIVEHPLVRKRN